MTERELQDAVMAALLSVAPEAEDQALDPDRSFRDQLDIDSMDFLNFLVALRDSVGIEVPESDYADVATLRGCLRYLAKRIEER